MISRSGNNVYRAGRYLERIEFNALYLMSQYDLLLDLPRSLNKDTVLKSVLRFTDPVEATKVNHLPLAMDDVFSMLTVDEKNPASITNHIAALRQLSISIRDIISPDLWEYINCFYHTMNSYQKKAFHQNGILGLGKKVVSNTLQIKGYIQDIMLRDEVWMLFSLGIAIEKVQLLNRMLIEIIRMSENGQDQHKNHDEIQFALLLENMGAYGMFKQLYHKNANREEALHFLILNTRFPKSIFYNLYRIHKILKNIRDIPKNENQLLVAVSRSLLKQEKSYEQDANNENLIYFLEHINEKLLKLAQQIESTLKKYSSEKEPVKLPADIKNP